MSMIKGSNTKPEIIVRRFLFKNGLRYRINYSKLPGKPDIVLSKYNSVIFVNGCFWHGHQGCKYFVVPKTRTEWWINKITRTKLKDIENISKLEAMGWKTYIVWECELKSDKKEKTLSYLYNSITCQN